MNAPTNSPAALDRLRWLTWWITIGCLLVIVGVVAAEQDAGRFAVVPAVLVVCAVAGRFFAVAVLDTPPPRAAVAVLLVLVAAAAAAGILASRSRSSDGFPAGLPMAALLAGAWVGAGWPWRLVWPVGIGLAFLASLGGSWAAGAISGGGAAEDAAIVGLCAAALYAQVWMLEVAQRLDQARRLESAAAVTDERLRFAADLHDIQGHSLQVIALKSELAERLAQADPTRAAAEMRDVQELARQTLGDTREVVRGYRAVALHTEVANAVRVLAAAGVECSVSRAVDLPALPSAVENLLGLVVRECTTNVLRHSAAGHCDISLSADGGRVLLRFSNDAPLDDRAAPAGGLAGLADRLAAVGGHLVVRGAPDTFTVSAHLPVTATR